MTKVALLKILILPEDGSNVHVLNTEVLVGIDYIFPKIVVAKGKKLFNE